MEKGSFTSYGSGTFKTSVASSSGIRDCCTPPSAGRATTSPHHAWPDVVFGKDIVEHRLALNVVRPSRRRAEYNTVKDAGVNPTEIEPQAGRPSPRRTCRLPDPSSQGSADLRRDWAPSRPMSATSASSSRHRLLLRRGHDRLRAFTIAYG